MNVDTMIDALVGREGGFSDNPADKGGPTRWGVTEHIARAYGYSGDMRTLPRFTAVDIYRERFWVAPHFDQVGMLSMAVAEELFDTGVNMGQEVAAKFLQRALNLLNRGATDYPDIAVDGAIGKLTLFALRSYQAKRGAAGEAVLLKVLNGFQLGRYADLTEARQANETFFYGWVANRIGELS